MTLEEEVNHPKHYTSHESGIQAIEITRYLIGDLSNAWKYAMRYEDKKTPKKDLQKLTEGNLHTTKAGTKCLHHNTE